MAIGMIILGVALVIGAPWLPELQINNFNNKELLAVYFGVLFASLGVTMIKMEDSMRRLKELEAVVEEEKKNLEKLRK